MIIAKELLNTEQKKAFNTLDTIFRMDRDEASELFTPYFVKYHSRLFRERGYLDCILRYVKWWAETLDVKGKDILDIGCGFGVYTLMFSFFGAKTVYGADHNAEKIAMFKKVLSIIEPPITNVKPSLQDGLGIDFEDNRFPAIFVKDVISHVRDLDSFLNEVSRLLDHDGHVLIADENNALEFAGRKERREKWRKWEFGGISEEDVRGGEPLMTYREMRREIIAEHLKDKDLSKMPGMAKIKDISVRHDSVSDYNSLMDILARKTIGLWGDEIIDATDELLKTGQLNRKPEFLYRHPKTGEFMEREFNPFKLALKMSDFGIKARVIKPRYYTQKPLLNIVGKILSSSHPLSIYFQPSFYISGKVV